MTKWTSFVIFLKELNIGFFAPQVMMRDGQGTGRDSSAFFVPAQRDTKIPGYDSKREFKLCVFKPQWYMQKNAPEIFRLKVSTF